MVQCRESKFRLCREAEFRYGRGKKGICHPTLDKLGNLIQSIARVQTLTPSVNPLKWVGGVVLSSPNTVVQTTAYILKTR